MPQTMASKQVWRSPQTIVSKQAWANFFASKTKKKRKKASFVCVSKAKKASKTKKKFIKAYNNLNKAMTRKVWDSYNPDMDYSL